jgi:NADH:ubiquinone oxidoreductase subunit 4 (subunit M)
VGSVILAALVLKIVGYVFIRFPSSFCPLGFHYISCYANLMCGIGILLPAMHAI